ncbi:MAG: RNA polymerase sporulation sigma factor SigK [Clostridia bacterium]|nr:RNA polymerase sporulation sigma factor SigK [Clostridia bacterium]
MWFLEILSLIPFAILHVITSNSFPKPLSAKEEKKYIEMLNGEESVEAKNKLINHNLRLVAHITKKYYYNKNDPDDLISIGTIGLIKAVNTFNPGKGIKLSSYASRCIENEILMYFRSLKKLSLDVSINEPIETDKNGNILTLMDTISTDDFVVDKIDVKVKIQKLKKYILKYLSKREQIILCLRYGLNGMAPLPQREVAKKLGISRSYVSRIEKKTLLFLKKCFK